MFIPRDELPLYALAVIASALIFRWTLSEIIRAVRDRGIPKCRQCEACGTWVWFRKPLAFHIPTRADVYAAGGAVVEAMATAEGIPTGPIVPLSPREEWLTAEQLQQRAPPPTKP